MLGKVIHDKNFWAAFMAAPLFVVALFLVSPPGVSVVISSLLVPMLLLILVYPLLEEVVFRGMLQGGLLQWSLGKRRWVGMSLANLLTSLAFVSLHFIYHSPIWAMAVFIPSLIFGFYRERYNSIVPAIILHCWYNACYYLVYLPTQ